MAKTTAEALADLRAEARKLGAVVWAVYRPYFERILRKLR